MNSSSFDVFKIEGLSGGNILDKNYEPQQKSNCVKIKALQRIKDRWSTNPSTNVIHFAQL